MIVFLTVMSLLVFVMLDTPVADAPVVGTPVADTPVVIITLWGVVDTYCNHCRAISSLQSLSVCGRGRRLLPCRS